MVAVTRGYEPRLNIPVDVYKDSSFCQLTSQFTPDFQADSTRILLVLAMNYISILFLELIASQCNAAPVPESIDIAPRQMPPMGPILPLAKMVYPREEPLDSIAPVTVSANEEALSARIYARQVAPWGVSAVASDNKLPIAARQVQPLQSLAATKTDSEPLPLVVAGELVPRQEPVNTLVTDPISVLPLSDPFKPLSTNLPVLPVTRDFDATTGLVARQNPVEPIQPLPLAEARARIVARQVEPGQPLPLSADNDDAPLGRIIARQKPVQPFQVSEKESAVLARMLTRQLNPVAVNAPVEFEESFVRAKGL